MMNVMDRFMPRGFLFNTPWRLKFQSPRAIMSETLSGRAGDDNLPSDNIPLTCNFGGRFRLSNNVFLTELVN